MSVTSTTRKRPLSEEPETDQSTSATEAKISKTEHQKVHASARGVEPHSDVISLLERQLEFNDDVMLKLRLFGLELSPLGREALKETLDMIKKRNVELKKELREKQNRLKNLPWKCQYKIFEHLDDTDLISLMLSDRFYDNSAGLVLKCRNNYLSALSIWSGQPDTVLKVVTSSAMPSGIATSYRHYHLEVKHAAALCEGYEEQKGNYQTRALHILFTHYDCSAATVSFGTCYTHKIPLTLEAFFGRAPSGSTEKIKIGGLVMTSHAVLLLPWFRPKHLDVSKSPRSLILASHEELKELVSGIDEITFSDTTPSVLVDKLMEACDAKVVFLRYGCYWSDESIISVIKANADSDNNGRTRTIKMRCSGRSSADWKKLCVSLMTSYEENPDGECTIEMPKCSLKEGRLNAEKIDKIILH